MEPELPSAVGRYQVTRVIHRGAMAVTYEGTDPAIDRPVAIQLIRADLLDAEQRAAFASRFLADAQSAARCKHPNLVTPYECALHQGNPFVAMELVRGESLADRMGRSRFGPADAVAMSNQVLSALDCAHDLGLVHGGITPAKILCLGDGTVKVAGLGLSRAAAGQSGPTQPGAMIGTPSYMSPEQCRGEEMGGRSDLFSVGALLYEMLAGERPFAGRSMTHVMARLLGEEPDDLASKAPDLPASLVAAVHRALAKVPEQRFASAAAMKSALDAAVQGVAIAKSGIGDLAAPEAVPAGIEAQQIERLTADLAFYLGPIARILVRRTLPDAVSAADLRQKLAANLGSAADQASFLRSR